MALERLGVGLGTDLNLEEDCISTNSRNGKCFSVKHETTSYSGRGGSQGCPYSPVARNANLVNNIIKMLWHVFLL